MLKNENFITIQGWMVNELDLKGNDLLVYAIIYGFSQDGESEFAGSRKYLAEWCNVSLPSIDKALNNLIEKGYILKTEKIINNVKFNTYKTLQVVKKLYRGCKETLQGGCKETLHNNIDIYNIDNNIDKEKKEKRKTEIDDFLEKQIEDIELRNIFCEFIKMRKSIKKPMTTYALQRMLAKLNRFTENIEEQKAILNKSIINCWQDIYSLNEKEKKDINGLKTNCKIETTEKNLSQYTIEYTDKLTETEYGELVREYGSEKYKELLSKYEKEGKVIKKKIEW